MTINVIHAIRKTVGTRELTVHQIYVNASAALKQKYAVTRPASARTVHMRAKSAAYIDSAPPALHFGEGRSGIFAFYIISPSAVPLKAF